MTALGKAVTQRTNYTAGLRALADLLDRHPELELPLHGGQFSPITVYPNRETAREQAQKWARAAGGADKDFRDGWVDVHLRLHGLRVDVTVCREAVCERVVTGTREVTKEIPDPEALAAVPTVTVTETVEDVDWVCVPLLAPARQAVRA